MTGEISEHEESPEATQAFVVMPTAWAELPYMSEVAPLNEADIPCLEEIRQVLAKHGRLDRLGVTLLHRHFEIGDEEILVEEIDFSGRRLIVRPIKKSVAGVCVETSWKLGSNAEQYCGKQHCWSTCIEQEKTFREMMQGATSGDGI
jgi:hypothetical protein